MMKNENYVPAIVSKLKAKDVALAKKNRNLTQAQKQFAKWHFNELTKIQKIVDKQRASNNKLAQAIKSVSDKNIVLREELKDAQE